MAITRVSQLLNPPTDGSGSYDPRTNRLNFTLHEKWLVETDDKTTSVTKIYSATALGKSLPRLGVAYVIDGAVYICDKVDPRIAKETPMAWEVDVSYYGFQLPEDTKKLRLGSVAYP